MSDEYPNRRKGISLQNDNNELLCCNKCGGSQWEISISLPMSPPLIPPTPALPYHKFQCTTCELMEDFAEGQTGRFVTRPREPAQ